MIRDPFARAYQVRDGKVRVPATVAEHGARLLKRAPGILPADERE